jgi:hypothetical protein
MDETEDPGEEALDRELSDGLIVDEPAAKGNPAEPTPPVNLPVDPEDECRLGLFDPVGLVPSPIGLTVEVEVGLASSLKPG